MFRTDEIDVKYYWSVIRRRGRVIGTAVGAGVALATLLNLVTQPTYRAMARIEVSKEPTRSALTGEAIASEDWRSDNVALFTAAELITTRAMLREVVIALQGRGISRRGGPGARIARGPGAWLSAAARRDAEASDLDREIDWLLSIMQVKPIRETRLVGIQVEHRDPATAREIADTITRTFVEYQKRQRLQADSGRIGYLSQQAQELSREVERLERKLYSSRQVGLSVLETRLKQLTETSGGLNDAHVRTRIERVAAGERLARVQAALNDPSGSASDIPVKSETLENLRHDLQQRETELAKAREIYKEKHPKLIILESELEAIRRSIRAELEKTVAALEDEYTALKGREDNLRSNLSQTDAQVRDVNDRLGQHAALESELSSKRELHTLVLGKVHEAEISGQVRAPLVKAVEPATVGSDPVRPRRSLNLLLGLMVGLLSGLGLALLLEYLRQCIRSPKDVTEHLQLPVLGMIPRRT